MISIELLIEEHAHHFLQGIKAECHGDRVAAGIIYKFLKEGKISEEEERILKTQLTDSLKLVGIGVPFALIPGASIMLPVLIKVANKHNIQLLPSAFIDPEKQR